MDYRSLPCLLLKLLNGHCWTCCRFGTPRSCCMLCCEPFILALHSQLYLLWAETVLYRSCSKRHRCIYTSSMSCTVLSYRLSYRASRVQNTSEPSCLPLMYLRLDHTEGSNVPCPCAARYSINARESRLLAITSVRLQGSSCRDSVRTPSTISEILMTDLERFARRHRVRTRAMTR
ncbi:hypothetical protein BD414DRAFT_475266 [Trametes punicea]|nr:hypothetical protein BD414DRAFT_475266 [Trametes punicea]